MSISYSSDFQCPIAVPLYVLQNVCQYPIAVSLYVLQHFYPMSNSNVSQCFNKVFASVLMQCPYISYRIVHQCPIAVSLYVLQQYLQVYYVSVSHFLNKLFEIFLLHCPTAEFSSVLLQCLSVSYLNVCQ